MRLDQAGCPLPLFFIVAYDRPPASASVFESSYEIHCFSETSSVCGGGGVGRLRSDGNPEPHRMV